MLCSVPDLVGTVACQIWPGCRRQDGSVATRPAGGGTGKLLEVCRLSLVVASGGDGDGWFGAATRQRAMCPPVALVLEVSVRAIGRPLAGPARGLALTGRRTVTSRGDCTHSIPTSE